MRLEVYIHFVTQIGSCTFTASFLLNHCSRCILQEADPEMDFSVQNAYAVVLVGLTSVEGRVGAGVGRGRGRGLRQPWPTPRSSGVTLLPLHCQ